VIFTGQAEATIDAKSRLAIPAKFRSRWDKDRDGPTWFCVPWMKTGSLRLYPERVYEELFRAGRRDPSLTPGEDQAELELILHSATEQVDVDATNRIRLVSWQVEALGLPGEVMVLGAGDRLEIRDRAGWQGQFKDKLGAMAALADRLSRANAAAAGRTA
jgi:MraZ protein